MSKEETQPSDPAWMVELSVKYLSGMANAFLLYGNVRDYAAGNIGLNLRDFLISRFASRDVVVCYSRAGGFYFPNKEHRQRFKELVGLTTAPTSGSGRAALFNAALGGNDNDTPLERIGQQPVEAVSLLTKFLTVRPEPKENGEPFRRSIILDYAEWLAPALDVATASEADRTIYVALAEWGRNPDIFSQENLITLLVEDITALNDQLKKAGSRWEQIELPFPTPAERAAFAREVLGECAEQTSLADDMDYHRLARQTTGLRLIDIHDIVLRAAYLNQPISRQLVQKHKDKIVVAEFDDVLQIVESDFGFEALGGMTEIKEALTQYVIEPMREGRPRLVPQGMLFMGPPGGGKSRIARALAHEAQFTFVELQPSKIYSKFVGDTERRLEKALTAIRSMTPVIVFIDEIDQALRRGEAGDSGVSNRIFKRLMEVMSDTSLRGLVLWMAATNRPDLLDAALLRPGRLDEKIPVLAPGLEERIGILKVLTPSAFAGVEQARLPDEAQYREMAEMTDGYTGAEMELVIGKALKLFYRAPDGTAVFDSLKEAHELIVPTTQDIELMTELALLHCSDLSLVPQPYREKARQLRRGGQIMPAAAPADGGIGIRSRRRTV